MTPQPKRKLDPKSRRLRWNATHQDMNWFKRVLINSGWAISTRLIIAWGKIRRIMFKSAPIDPGDWWQPTDDASDDTNQTPLEPFPDDFLWGAAMAAIQAEGCIDNTDWSLFTTNPEIVERVRNLSGFVGRAYNLQPIGVAAHHGDLEVLKKDLDRAVLLGLNAYRFSIEWARVIPNGPTRVNREALKYYSDAVDAMIKRGLEPIVTLNHVSLPLWISTPPVQSGPPVLPSDLEDATSSLGIPNFAVEDEGYREASGWENPDTIDHYLDFVQVIVDELASRVSLWITLNEPASMATIGYLGGIWPPGFSLASDRAQRAYFNLLKAHSRAFIGIKDHYATNDLDSPRVGIALAIVHFSLSSEVAAEAQAAADGAINGGVIGFVLGGALGLIIGAFFYASAVALLGPVGLIVGPIISTIVVGLVGLAVGAAIGAITAAIWGHFNDINEVARDQADYFYNRHLLDSLTSGSVDVAINHEDEHRVLEDAVSFFHMGDNAVFMSQLDFIGVNYYRNASVHYDPILARMAPYTGGAVFNNDLRNVNDLPGQKYSNEEHGILNDLGWDMFPEGISIMLEELGGYNLPIIITENGFAESNDRNRAPYLLAHLQQIRISMERDVKVIGYCYWSFVDNFEWQAGYEPASRFGLFTVVRPADQSDVGYDCEAKPHGETFDRRITEGALALQYVTACNKVSISPFPGAIERFGIMAPDGKSIVPPTRQAGALWEATVDLPNELTRTFQLYLTHLDPHGGWLGMIFDHATREWIRLERLNVNVDPFTSEVTLHFEHPVVIWVELGSNPPTEISSTPSSTSSGITVPIERTLIYSATPSLPSDGVFATLEGSVRTDLMPAGALARRWTATPNLKVGLWAMGINGTNVQLAIRNWEGESFRPFQVKYLIGSGSWEPRRARTRWSDSTLTVTNVVAYEGPRLSSIEATLNGVELSGSAEIQGSLGSTSVSWSGTRVQEDFDFL
jgi:beta-glucosidase/6-phospho-beta-glucosidase/beta-galactosidase